MTGPLIAGRYRMQRRLGSGGMATVFLARDERLERDVAIKRLHADSAEDVAHRFEREAKVGASLNHPNIVSVYDTETDDESVFIIMEYVPGHTLRDEIARGPIAPARTIAILRALASALDHVHEHGVVHRDVKPANVLIDERGDQVKLADLGIATAAEQTRITHSGAVMGTAAYMAPERLDGGGGEPAVDIYALAALAYEMLSGRKAVEGSTPLEIARRVASAPPPDLRQAVPDAPAAAAAALERGLAKRPEERPGSAAELVRELEAAYAAPAKPPPLPEPAPAVEPAPVERRSPAPAVAALAGATAPSREHPVEEPARRNGADGASAPPAGPARNSYASDGGRRRWALPAALAAAAALLVAIVVVALASSGGSSGDGSAGAGSASKTANGSGKSSSSASHGSGASQDGSGTASSSGTATSAAPGAAAGAAPSAGSGSAAGGTSTPTGAVATFYRTSISDPSAAWALGTDRLHNQLGSEQSFAGQEQTLQSIDFPSLSVSDQSASSATVQFRSVAHHTNRTDHCHGGIGVVKVGSAWKIDQLESVDCTHGPT